MAITVLAIGYQSEMATKAYDILFFYNLLQPTTLSVRAISGKASGRCQIFFVNSVTYSPMAQSQILRV